jgi:hypothetical protein
MPHCAKPERKNAEQNRTEQNKTEQNRTERMRERLLKRKGWSGGGEEGAEGSLFQIQASTNKNIS